jgi:hypothetical protein
MPLSRRLSAAKLFTHGAARSEGVGWHGSPPSG